MNIVGIIAAIAIVGCTGCCGIFPCFASEKFKVEVDERETAILDVLPEITVEAAAMQGAPVWLQRL